MNICFTRIVVLAIITVSFVANVYGQEKEEKKEKPEQPVNTITVNGKTISLDDDPGRNTITINGKDGKKVISVKSYDDSTSRVNNPQGQSISNTNVNPAPITPPNPAGTVFMWKAENNGQVCYLLGSIHFLKPQHYPLHGTIETAFNNSDVLAVEADISGANGMSAANSLMQQAMYPDGRTVKDEISDSTYDLLKEKLEGISLGMDYIMKFKPWFVAMTIMQYQLARIGYDANAGVDMYFLNKAAQKGMPVEELEGLSFQMDLFNSFSRMENEHFLLSAIVSTDKLQEQITKTVSAWSAGDARTLHQNNTHYLSQYPELLPMYKRLNDDRNVTMTQKVMAYMNSGKTHFVVVGAAHLTGPNGIVSLLRNKGYTVTQQ